MRYTAMRYNTCEMHVYEEHDYEIGACEVHTYEMHARGCLTLQTVVRWSICRDLSRKIRVFALRDKKVPISRRTRA